MTDKRKLLEDLSEYGFPLLRSVAPRKPEEVLKDLLKEDDVRLLEGFPVVFAGMLRDEKPLSWEDRRRRNREVLSAKSERRLSFLLALTYYTLRLFGSGEEFEARTKALLLRLKNGKEFLRKLEEPFLKSEAVTLDGLELSTERMKRHFQNYVVHAPEKETMRRQKHELELELLLSELFTPKQKELMRKRLEHKALAKTEREYFSRVVKKRLKALADDELHQMAKTLVSK